MHRLTTWGQYAVVLLLCTASLPGCDVVWCGAVWCGVVRWRGSVDQKLATSCETNRQATVRGLLHGAPTVLGAMMYAER